MTRVVNPGMLSLARDARGLSQHELAAKTGMSQPKISRFELGGQPSPEDLRLIATALEFDVEFFFLSDPIHAVGASLLYRQRAGAAVKDQRRVEAEINVRKIQVSRLLKSCSLGEHSFPSIPTDTFDGNIEEIARQVRKKWSVPPGPIHDLTALVESVGGIVIHMDFGSKIFDGAHLWVAGLPPLFFMNNTVAGERYRFSLAHEIGHAVMHRASGFGEIEEEAQKFASEFLMPRQEIRSDLRNFTVEAARRLKPFWKVSMQALLTRAHDLRCIDATTQRRMWQTISARGMRVTEPWPIPMEKAAVFDRLCAFHRDTIGLSAPELRRVLFADFGGTIGLTRSPDLRLTDDAFAPIDREYEMLADEDDESPPRFSLRHAPSDE